VPIVPPVPVPFATTRAGLVPAPGTSTGRVLLDSGSWGQPAGPEVDLVNDEATTVVAGTPVYLYAAGHFKKAKADDIATGRAIGVAKADIAAGATGKVQLGNTLTLTTAQWDAICGTSGGLSFDVPYYLDAATAGHLTPTPPNVAGQVKQQVIVGVSPTIAIIDRTVPEVIGDGSNVDFLRNDNAGAIIFGQPVYSSSAAGCDLGIADNSGKGTIIGLVADASIASGARGKIVMADLIVGTTAQWDAIAGTVGGLTFNTTYYLSISTAGRLTSVAPSSPTDDGKQVVVVISALSTTEARIAIQPPVLL
jgi:hypothetical protein